MRIMVTDLRKVSEDLAFVKTNEKSNQSYLRCKINDFKIIFAPNPNNGVMPERFKLDCNYTPLDLAIPPATLLDKLNDEYKLSDLGSVFTLPPNTSFTIKKLDLRRKLMLVEPKPSTVDLEDGILYLIKSTNVNVIDGDLLSTHPPIELNDIKKFLENAENAGVSLDSTLCAVYSPYDLMSKKNVIKISTKTITGTLKYTISGKTVEIMKEKKELDDFIFG